MRTKTTILSAVALAAGLLSSHAQVYSANVVGYCNIVTPLGTAGNSKKHLVANQLLGTGNTNDINITMVAGLDDSTDQKVNLLIWNGAGFSTYTYYGPTSAGNSTGIYADQLGNPAVGVNLNQADAAFLENFSGRAVTNTIVGQVVQGPFNKTITVGKAPYSIVVPVSTNLLAPFVFVAHTDALDQHINMLHYNVGLQKFDGALTYYGPTSAGNAVGAWADQLGTDQTFNSAYYPAVGEGFFLDLYGVPSYTWTSSFSVQ